MLIQNEEEKDWAAVHALNVAAFETPAEAKRFGISCEYEVPEEVFMVVELQPGVLHAASGKVKYHAAFSKV